MWLSIIKDLTMPVIGIFKERQRIKAKEKERKERISEAKAEREIENIRSDKDKASDLDLYFVKNSESKRNYSFYLMSMPVALCFYPPAVQHITAGFEALEKLPEWYKIGLAGMMISIWGFRRLLMMFIHHKLGKAINERND